VNIGKVAIAREQLYVGSVPERTGYMELCPVCVLPEGTLVQGRKRESSEDMLLDGCLLKQHL